MYNYTDKGTIYHSALVGTTTLVYITYHVIKWTSFSPYGAPPPNTPGLGLYL